MKWIGACIVHERNKLAT